MLTRASGDWIGLAHALAAKARLQAAAGRFEEAVGGFTLVLKVWIYLGMCTRSITAML